MYHCSTLTIAAVGNLAVELGLSKVLSGYWDVLETGIKSSSEQLSVMADDRIRRSYTNIDLGLSFLVNVTDAARTTHTELLQAVYDELYDFIIVQLKSPQISSQKGHRFTWREKLLFPTCLNLIYNFASNLDKSLPHMRETGLHGVVHKMRDESKSYDVQTTCLLILAYILDEGDDKTAIEMSSDELSYLIAQLEKALLIKSDYSPEELIEGLNRIAVIDVNKVKLVDCGYLDLLKKSMKGKYEPAHQAAAAKGIWNLVFSDKLRPVIQADQSCIEGDRLSFTLSLSLGLLHYSIF